MGACSSNEAPETLPLLDETPATARVTTSEVTTTQAADADAGMPVGEDTLAALSPDQMAHLEACATSVTDAAAGVPAGSASYADDVAAVLLAPESDVMALCGPVLHPSSGIDQGLMISFMFEHLPPELLTNLSALAPLLTGEGSPVTSPGIDAGAIDGGAIDAGATLQAGPVD